MSDTSTNLGEVTYTRVYDAPRELVFRCMIEPEHLTHFWGPVGVSTPIENITIDPRPGGVFETIMVNDANGDEYPSRGVFVEVVEPERLVWTEPDVEGGMTTSITFTDLGDGKTEVFVHQTNVPEMYRSPEAQAGMQEQSFDRSPTSTGHAVTARTNGAAHSHGPASGAPPRWRTTSPARSAAGRPRARRAPLRVASITSRAEIPVPQKARKRPTHRQGRPGTRHRHDRANELIRRQREAQAARGAGRTTSPATRRAIVTTRLGAQH